MTQEEVERNGEEDRSRPRVVDRRISARRDEEMSAPPQRDETPPPPPPEPPPEQGERIWTPEQEAEAQRVAQEIVESPASDWVVNAAVTLANVAAVKIDAQRFDDASLAIDALAAIVDKLEHRLDQAGPALRQTVAQLQMAYAQRATPPPETPAS